MKKLKVFVVVAFLLFAGSAMAQTKMGYITVDNVVRLMPATAKIDSIMERYDTDSIQPEYTNLIEQYQFNDSLYRDSTRTPPSVRAEIAKKLPGMIYQIQNWSQIRQQAVEGKQQELLAPIYNQIFTALKAVAKEKGYTHVFDKAAFLIAPDGDDLLPAVAAKLKLTVPPQLQPGYKGPAVAPGK